MKQMIITFLIGAIFIYTVLTIYSIRIDKINNGELILVDQHEK